MRLIEVLKCLHNDDTAVLSVTPARRAEYCVLFGAESTTAAEGSTALTDGFGDKYFCQIRDEIVAANPMYGSVWKDLAIVCVTGRHDVTSVHSTETQRAIIVDSFAMVLSWAFNKALVYGPRLGRARQIKLFLELLLHFATTKNSERLGGIWPKPETPAHNSVDEFIVLSQLTRIQEMFIVAHEMSHLVVDSVGAQRNQLLWQSDFATAYWKIFPRNEKIDEELAVDELAIELVVNAHKKQPLIQQAVLSSIFLLIRYRLWLSIASESLGNDFDHQLWFARNSHFRQKVQQIYCGGPASFLIEVLSELEETLEPAAIGAGKVLASIMADAGRNPTPGAPPS